MDVTLVAEGKTIAILFDVEVRKCLRHIRDLISEQVADLMPSDKYVFVHEGMKVSEATEHLLTIEQTVSPMKSDDLSDEDSSSIYVVLSFGECNDGTTTMKIPEFVDTCATPPAKTPNKILTPSFGECNDGTTTMRIPEFVDTRATPQAKTPTKMLALKSPTAAEIRGLKIYTENEIKKGKGSQPVYRQFWNKKIKELARNRAWSNEEVCKRVNDEWRLHRTTLLVKESKDMNDVLNQRSKSVGNHTQDGPKAKKMKAKTLPSNVSRLNAAVQRAEDLTLEISLKNKALQNAVNPASEIEAKAELSRLEASLDSTKSEIRKAQDTLRKNLQTKQSEISKFFRK